MAVETERPPAGAFGALHRGMSGLGGLWQGLRARVRNGLAAVGAPLAPVGAFLRRIGLYQLLTEGPIVRFVSKTLLRRIIFANLIGLAVLLGGVFYLSQYHAWLIEAKRDSLQAQGEVIAAAIAASATREKDTGRIVINPDMLPEIEGARGLLRDENIASMQLSIPPERVAPLF